MRIDWMRINQDLTGPFRRPVLGYQSGQASRTTVYAWAAVIAEILTHRTLTWAFIISMEFQHYTMMNKKHTALSHR
jgi:predicted ABC-type exoprotein transport system permease subunit